MTDEQQQYIRMTETPVPKLIASLAAPAVFSMLITSVYNMTDTYFVSKLGNSAAAAVGVVFALMSLIQSIGFTVGMGASTYISRFLGRQEPEKAEEYASSAIACAALLGTLMMIFGLIFITPLMRALGSTETALPYARDYARYILIGSPVMCLVFVFNNILRAEGLANLSMIGVISGGIFNMILDPILIFVFDMGITGAAVATLVSQVLSLVVLAFIFFSGKSIIKVSVRQVSRDIRIYWNIITNGFPTLCRQGLATVATALLSLTAKVYGDAAIAAMTIAMKIYMLVRSLVVGIGQGFQPMAGYNYGAGRYSRVKKGFWFTVGTGTVICVAAAVFLFFFGEFTISLFREDDQTVIKAGADTLKYFCYVMPMLAYSTIVNQLLQSLGRSRSAAFLASCRQGVFYIPIILVFSGAFGLTGIEISQSAADLLTFIASVPFQIHFFVSASGIGRKEALSDRKTDSAAESVEI